jgi:hypothetical protein
MEWNKLMDCGKKIEIEALQKLPSFFIPFINSIKKTIIEKKFIHCTGDWKKYFECGGQFKSRHHQLKKTPPRKKNKTLIDMLAAAATTAAKWIAADNNTW